MDISAFETSAEARPLTIKHPETKKDTDIIIYCISPDHPDYAARMVNVARADLKPDQKGDEAVKAMLARKVHVVAKMIEGWDSITMKGKAFKYSEKNAIKLLTEYPWITDQVDDFCAKRANFFKGSSKA